VGALAHGLAHRPQALWAPAKHLLVVGHMRSNTTVLSYILGSHPEIVGAAEIHQSYRRPLDLVKLRCRLLRTHQTKWPVGYFLDKLLHDRYAIDDGLLRRPDVHVLFLLRRPEQTLRSILAMGSGPDEPPKHADPQWVTQYYEKRMGYMAGCAQRMAELGVQARASVLTAEDFVSRPDEVLAGLTRRLGLATPLSSKYEVFAFTGRRGAGDRSSNIRSGEVVKKTTDYSAIALDPALLARAQQAHAQGLAAIRQHAVDVG